MKIQVMAAKISAWGFFWTFFPMLLSVFCYLFILTPFAKLSPKLNHISDKKRLQHLVFPSGLPSKY